MRRYDPCPSYHPHTVAAVSPASAQTYTDDDSMASADQSADESSERSSQSPLSSDENSDPTMSSQIIGLLGLTVLSWGMIPLLWASMQGAHLNSGNGLSTLPLMALLAIAPPTMASSMIEEGSSN